MLRSFFLDQVEHFTTSTSADVKATEILIFLTDYKLGEPLGSMVPSKSSYLTALFCRCDEYTYKHLPGLYSIIWSYLTQLYAKAILTERGATNPSQEQLMKLSKMLKKNIMTSFLYTRLTDKSTTNTIWVFGPSKKGLFFSDVKIDIADVLNNTVGSIKVDIQFNSRRCL